MDKNDDVHGQEAQVLLNKIVLDFMRDQKNKKRWRLVMRILIIGILLTIAYSAIFLSNRSLSSKNSPHVGVIDLKGTIMEGESGSADNFAKSLNKAYKNKNLKAMIIRINSPGGSPVQADYMFNLLQFYKKKHPKIKTYAVCVDMCASAAYYVAAATDDIYANKSSMIGSIGVIYNGFGFVDAMKKIGVERRLLTAGKNKGFLDPFSAEKPEQEKYLQEMLDDVHQQFIAKVKEGRGDRLKINDNTFSGLIWTGDKALEQGLIDGFASTGQLARDTIKIKKMVNYTHKESVFEKVAKNMGSAMADRIPLAMGMKPGLN